MATHRYWRIRFVNSGDTNCSVGTMSFKQFSDGADFALGSYATWTEYDAEPGYAGKWRDGSNTTFWFAALHFGVEHWFKGDFGAASGGWPDIRCFTVNDATTGRTNAEWMGTGTLEYSDDGSAWTTQMSLTRGGVAVQTWGMVQADIAAPMATLSAYGGMNSAIVVPTPTAVGYCGASATIQAPAATAVTYFGSNASASSPMATLYAQGHDSTGENAADITAPMATLAAYMGMTAALAAPMPTLSATATGTNWLTANVTAPMATLEATGTVSGTSRANVTAPMATLIGYGGMVCNVTITGSPTLDAHVTSGSTLNAGITGPMAELTLFEVTAEAYCNANIIAPMGKMGGQLQAWITAPMATLTAIGTATITATYEAYAVNLNHKPRGNTEPVDETTRYTNFPFTHVVRYQNSYYGANSTGLYLLEGTTDDATPIPWAVKTAMTDFDSPTHKTVASAYFGGRLGPADTITLHAGEGAQTQAYSYTTPRGALAQNYRQVFGKGIRKHRYYALAASGNGEFEIDDIELDVVNMTRRI